MKVTIAALLVFSMVLPSFMAESLFLNDLSPEDVQSRLASQSLDLSYAKFLGQRTLPAEEVSAYNQGRIAEHPEDYVQQIYQANQFHGQDGLGRSMFGYTDWNQGRLEARNANGEVRGSYQYVDAFGDNVVVNYWSDSLGFHQTDNRKVAEVDVVTETPEVQAARLAHQRAWDAAAKAAQENPDPMSDVYNANANRLDEEQSEYDQAQQIIASQQAPNRYLSSKKSSSNINRKSDIELDQDTVLVQAAESRTKNQYQRVRNDDSAVAASENNERVSERGPPRGFFYTFDYPVQVLVDSPVSNTRSVAKPVVKPVEIVSRTATVAAPEIVADPEPFRIVPIRIIDSQKIKRSDQGTRRRQAIQNRFQRMNPTVVRSTRKEDAVLPINPSPTVDTPIQTITPHHSRRPAHPTKQVAADPSQESSEIIKIKSIEEQQHEHELQRLAGGSAQTIDAVHDAQIHPKQRV